MLPCAADAQGSFHPPVQAALSPSQGILCPHSPLLPMLQSPCPPQESAVTPRQGSTELGQGLPCPALFPPLPTSTPLDLPFLLTHR